MTREICRFCMNEGTTVVFVSVDHLTTGLGWAGVIILAKMLYQLDWVHDNKSPFDVYCNVSNTTNVTNPPLPLGKTVSGYLVPVLTDSSAYPLNGTLVFCELFCGRTSSAFSCGFLCDVVMLAPSHPTKMTRSFVISFFLY